MARRLLGIFCLATVGIAQWTFATCARAEDRSKMSVLQFPGQVAHRQLKDREADDLFRDPSKQLEVRAGEVVVTADRVRLAVIVTNTKARLFPLVVNPYGGTFPYGGDSPLLLQISQTSLAKLKYVGEIYPPEPPLPMLIEFPGGRSVQFDAEIDLRNFAYHGTPEVTLEWSFRFFHGDPPRGETRIRLPARRKQSPRGRTQPG